MNKLIAARYMDGSTDGFLDGQGNQLMACWIE